VSALREIFDESAYNRFLDRRQLPSSREAYAAFRRNTKQPRRADHAAAEKPSCECPSPVSIKANPGHTLTTDKLPLTTETKINFPHARPGR